MGSPAFEAITLAIEDGIATITLNRPETLNALNAAMFLEVPRAVAQSVEAGARALLITGAGRGFCSGADLVGPRFATPPTEELRGCTETRLMEQHFAVVCGSSTW